MACLITCTTYALLLQQVFDNLLYCLLVVSRVAAIVIDPVVTGEKGVVKAFLFAPVDHCLSH